MLARVLQSSVGWLTRLRSAAVSASVSRLNRPAPKGGGYIHALRPSPNVRSEITPSHLPLGEPQHGTH